MKRTMNLGLAALATVLLSCGVFCDQAQAIATPINGSIEFFGSATPSGSSPGSPVNVVFSNPWHTLAGIGDYAGVPFGISATFTNFSFTGDGTGASLSGSVVPLWSFSFGGISYSLDLHSLSNGHTANGSLAFSGSGTAHATGFDETPATWALQGAGQNYVFTLSSSTTSAVGAVPDGGTTAGLFGMALVGIACLRRQFRAA